MPIYWLTGKKVADDYRDFYDGTWDNPNDAINMRGASVNRRAWPHATGSRSDGTVDPTGFLGHPSGKIRTGSGDNPLGGGELTDVDRPFYIYALSPIFEVRPPKPDVAFKNVAVKSDEVTLKIDAYEHEDVPLTGLELNFHRLPKGEPVTVSIASALPSDASLNGSVECGTGSLDPSEYTSHYECALTWTPDQLEKWYLVQLEGVWATGRTEIKRIYFRSGSKRTYEPAPAHFEFPTTAPSRVRGLTSEVGEAGITLSWREPEDDGGSDMVFYRVERQTEGSDYVELDSGTLETGYLDPSPPASGRCPTGSRPTTRPARASGWRSR